MNLPRSKALPAVLALSMAGLPAAKAADAQDAAPVPKIEIKGSAYDARRQDAGTRIVIKQQELARFGTTTLSETLTRLPGITLTSSGAIAMRGLGEGYVQILLNGQPLPPGFSVDTLAPELIDSVEVMRASTADIGAQSMAGTINIVLKKESKTDQREVKGGVQAGQGLREWNLNLQRSGADGPLSYALGVSGSSKTTEMRWTDMETGRDYDDLLLMRRINNRFGNRRQEILGLAPRATYKLDGGGSWSLQTFLNAQRIGRTSGLNATTLLGAEPAHASEGSRFDERNWLLRNDLSVQRPFANGAKLDLKLGQSASSRSTDFEQVGYRGDGAQKLDSNVTSRVTEKGWNTTGKYTNSLLANHAIALGWDGRRPQRSENRVEHALAFTDVPAIDSDDRFTATINRLALYAQDEWTPSPGLSVYLGLRWESLTTRSAGNHFAPVHVKSSIFFPVMQVRWQIPGGTNDQVRVALTRTFNPPELVKLTPRLFTSYNNTPIYPDRRGNPFLRPEVAAGIDAAYEHYWANKAMMSVGVYAREIDDFIREEVVLSGGRWLVTNINGGGAKTRGLEFELKMPLRNVGATLPDVDLSANLTRNWSSVDEVPGPYNRIAQQTRFSGTLAFDYRSPARTLTAGASLRFKSGGPLRVTVQETQYAVPVRTLDMYAAWKVRPKLQVRLSLLNLLHQPTQIDYHHAGPASRYSLFERVPTYASVRLNLEHQFQ